VPKGTPLKEDWRVSKYYRMVKMGVPPGGVKGKMQVLSPPNSGVRRHF
jgi:hypothetical protein